MKQSRFFRFSLRAKVILVLVFLQISFIAAFGALQVYNEYLSTREFLRDSSVTFARCIAHSSAPLIGGEPQDLEDHLLLTHAQHGQDINYVFIQDEHGRVIASTWRGLAGTTLKDEISQRALLATDFLIQELRSPSPRLYTQCAFDLAVPIVTGGRRVAILRLGVSSQSVHGHVWNVAFRSAWMAALALAVGGVLALVVDRRLRHSLQELTFVTRRIAEGDLRQRVQIRTGDELQVLGDTFNVMTEQLKSSREELKRWAEELETKVRERTHELEEERQKLDGIVSGIGAGLVLLNGDLKVLWANRIAGEWFGPPEALYGRSCFAALWREQTPCQGCPTAKALLSGKVEQSEKVVPQGNGQGRFLQITTSLIRDEKGEIVQLVELIQDITDKKQMEAQLIQAGKMVAMGELASGIAHEINNPLAVIGANAERLAHLLAAGRLPPDRLYEKFPPYLDAIQRHTYRCKEIIEKLLNFARQKEVELQPTDVNLVMEEAVALIAHKARVENKKVVKELAPALPLIHSDPNGLEQVFLNILTNAIDAIDGSGEIRVTSRLVEGQLVVEVSDTGVGIPPEHLEAIFRPFFTTKPQGKGTGLGLAICARIIEHLKGRVTVRSAPGQGTTFSLFLPLEGSTHAAEVASSYGKEGPDPLGR